MDARIARRAPREGSGDLWSTGVLPVLAVGALSGLVGVYWDIAWHIDKGRDSFFTLPHNFIYLAILITLLVGLYGLVRDRRATALHLPVGRFRLHPGVLIVTIGAALELFFAPADDLWHRLFGVDVTLWAPMHLIGLLGLTLLSFGGLVTAWVERRLTSEPSRRRLFEWLSVVFGATLLGWFMLYLAEFEFNVPVFPMLWHPLLLTALPVLVLVLMARLAPVPWAGTWTALGFGLLRLAIAGLLALTAVVDLAGETRPMIPLLLPIGLAADLFVRRRTPLWLTGLGLGAIAFASAYPLILLSDINWHRGALTIGVPAGLAASVAAAYLGAAIAAALRGDPATAPAGEVRA